MGGEKSLRDDNDSNRIKEITRILDRVEEVAHTVNEIIASKKEQKEETRLDRISRKMRVVTSNWALFLFILSIFSVFIGWIIFDVSPLQPLEEIATKQREYRLTAAQEEQKSEIVSRHLKLGSSFLNVMQLDAAKIEFEEALALDPVNISAKRGLFKAEIFRPIVERDYDPEIMEKRLNLILEENPDDPHAFLFLGQIYSSIDPEQALAYYQKAIRKDPSIAAAYFGIGVIYDLQNKPDEAVIMYEKALNISQWNQLFLDNLGYHYYFQKEYQKAIEKYELLLRLDDHFLPAYYTVSNAYRLTGNFEQARLDQERLIMLLGNTNVTSMRRNQQAWFFPIKNENVYFYDYPEKKFYAFYNLALTYYILGNETKATDCVKKAKDLQINEYLEQDVKKLVSFDIDNLQVEHDNLWNRSEEFRRRFL